MLPIDGVRLLAVPDLWLQPVDAESLCWAEGNSSVLDDDEQRRWRRYQSADARALFVVAHVATRHVLSQRHGRDPASWRFERGTHGRPEIVDGPPGVRFNLSHTAGMIALLLHGEADHGVDVEHIRRETDMESVARRVFTEAEQASIRAQPDERRADRFYELWTLKEAFIKAKGAGLAMPLQQFSFAISESDQSDPLIEFECDAAIDPAPDQWHFTTLRPTDDHVVSVAAQRDSGPEDMDVVVHRLSL